MVETHRRLALGAVGGRALWGLAAIAVTAGAAGGRGRHDHCVQAHCERAHGERERNKQHNCQKCWSALKPWLCK